MREHWRYLSGSLASALDASRVVVLHGPRQSGKTTLARRVAQARGGDYVTLDDDATADLARNDPHSFVRAYRSPLVIDEVQRAGDRLVRAVKIAVDDGTNETGRFLLTASSNFLTVPTISESLAGRVVILTLWPFCQAELRAAPFGRMPSDAEPDHLGWPFCQAELRAAPSGADPTPTPSASPVTPSAVERWFDSDCTQQRATRSSTARRDYLHMLCVGGFPEVQSLSAQERTRWFTNYAETVVSRDIAQIGDIRRTALLGQMLRLAAAETSNGLNVTRWAQRLGADRATVQSYLGWLRTVFLVYELPAWRRSRGARVVKRSKLHMGDSGLAAALAGVNASALDAPSHPMTGALFETFAVCEITRLCSASAMPIALYHYRDAAGSEIDLVLERADGAVVAVEIKSTASPRGHDLRHLSRLRKQLDDSQPGTFRAGVLLHAGANSLPHGDRLRSASLDSLWQSDQA